MNLDSTDYESGALTNYAISPRLYVSFEKAPHQYSLVVLKIALHLTTPTYSGTAFSCPCLPTIYYLCFVLLVLLWFMNFYFVSKFMLQFLSLKLFFSGQLVKLCPSTSLRLNTLQVSISSTHHYPYYKCGLSVFTLGEPYQNVVPGDGLEPSCHCWRGILSPLCLPNSTIRAFNF